jgi:hypothetical protein
MCPSSPFEANTHAPKASWDSKAGAWRITPTPILDNQVAIITGAGSRSGQATALAFAAEGAYVVFADDPANGKPTTPRIQGTDSSWVGSWPEESAPASRQTRKPHRSMRGHPQ